MLIVGLSGNAHRPSRTRTLVEGVLAGFDGSRFRTKLYDLVDAGPGLGATMSLSGATGPVGEIAEAIKACDGLVIGSPVYKASYAGLLKHLIDLLDVSALKGKPVILTATAKAPGHALMIDHQFRPLFGFFGAASMPTGLYAIDPDISDTGAFSDALSTKIAAAIGEMTDYLSIRSAG